MSITLKEAVENTHEYLSRGVNHTLEYVFEGETIWMHFTIKNGIVKATVVCPAGHETKTTIIGGYNTMFSLMVMASAGIGWGCAVYGLGLPDLGKISD